MISVKNSKNYIAKLILSKDVDINCTCVSGETALMFSSMYDNYESCKMLISKKARIDCKNILGEDAISLAHSSSSKLINLLVNYKTQGSLGNDYDSNKNLTKQNTLKGIKNNVIK